MKPKNKVYCKDCGRQKMLFETDKKANAFIKFNSEDIASQSGYSPTRSYYCIFCNGWHVTSRTDNIHTKSKTEEVLELYEQHKKKKKLEQEQRAEIRKANEEELNRRLDLIEKQIQFLEAFNKNEDVDTYIKVLNTTFSELEFIKYRPGYRKRKISAEEQLNKLKEEVLIIT